MATESLYTEVTVYEPVFMIFMSGESV